MHRSFVIGGSRSRKVSCTTFGRDYLQLDYRLRTAGQQWQPISQTVRIVRLQLDDLDAGATGMRRPGYFAPYFSTKVSCR
jgi:hypothetical protein